MKKLLAFSVVFILCDGLSLSAQEPLRAEKPTVEKSQHWLLLFDEEVVLISSASDVPTKFITSTIEAMQDAGHQKFALKVTKPDQPFPPREAKWMRISVTKDVAEIDVDPELVAQNLVSMIEHLGENGVKRV